MTKVVEDTSNDVSNNKKMILDDSKGANTASNEQGTGLTRNTIDKFYTSASVAGKCMELLKDHIVISDEDIVIEPSAGDGAFVSFIEALCPNSAFYDLIPGNEESHRTRLF